jgi:hypothetical protein
MDSPYYEIVMRVNSLSDAKLYFSVGCGNNCMGSIELPVSKMAEWEAINVPLSCLKKDGLNESKVQIRGLFSSEEQINFDVNSIIIKDGAITGTKVSC